MFRVLNLRHVSLPALTRRAARRVIKFMSDEVLTATEHRILDGIAAHGWYSQHIFFPELEAPNFTYTIGFSETLNAPEFIIFGLHRDVM